MAPPWRGVRPVWVLRRVRAGLHRREDGGEAAAAVGGVADPVVVGGGVDAGGHGRLSNSGKQRCGESAIIVGLHFQLLKIIFKKIWYDLLSLSYVRTFFRA